MFARHISERFAVCFYFEIAIYCGSTLRDEWWSPSGAGSEIGAFPRGLSPTFSSNSIQYSACSKAVGNYVHHVSTDLNKTQPAACTRQSVTIDDMGDVIEMKSQPLKLSAQREITSGAATTRNLSELRSHKFGKVAAAKTRQDIRVVYRVFQCHYSQTKGLKNQC